MTKWSLLNGFIINLINAIFHLYHLSFTWLYLYQYMLEVYTFVWNLLDVSLNNLIMISGHTKTQNTLEIKNTFILHLNCNLQVKYTGKNKDNTQNMNFTSKYRQLPFQWYIILLYCWKNISVISIWKLMPIFDWITKKIFSYSI